MDDASPSPGAAGAPQHDELPLPDYDHLPLGDLTHRVRTLDAGGLGALVAYEQEHGARTPVLQVLQTRLDQLRGGAEPSGGNPTAPSPEAAPPAQEEQTISPATAGPKINPPSQGDPTNPAQPRT